MLDFLMISTRSTKRGVIEIYPKFVVRNSNDLMIQGGNFYAVWVEDRGLWSTDEQDVVYLIDKILDKYAEENRQKFDSNIKILHMWDAETGVIDSWHKYCKQQMWDSFQMLDEKLVFSNAETNKQDYASKKLNYPLEAGNFSAFDTLMSTLYSEEERHKIEWAIGSVVSGESKKLQKFLVLYGSAGTGKSTVLNVIDALFDGYCSVFDAKALGSSSNSFALEAFKNNPLVAIQHDGDLSKIEDNTRLNSLVSHEMMTVNEKFKSTYSNRFKCFLFMGTNKPVKITDGRSGLIRRLIDVSPTGNKVDGKEYKKLVKRIDFELGAIAYHCQEVYLDNPAYYDDYIPTMMLGASNDFYNFVFEQYHIFKNQDGVTMKAAWEMYKTFCDETKVPYPLAQRTFKEELRNYFWNYDERPTLEDGSRPRNYYSGFRADRFEGGVLNKTDESLISSYKQELSKLKSELAEMTKDGLGKYLRENRINELTKLIFEEEYKKKEVTETSWLNLNSTESIFDKECSNWFAQYANAKDIPTKCWADVKTKLSDLDTFKVHYIAFPEENKNHIIADFDLTDEKGEKSFEKNAQAASLWPPTYAEVSKGGAGIHLHYIYTGDVNTLSRIYDDHIEIKVFTGDSSLRRRLSKCNDLPIAKISSGLPLKGENKVVNFEAIKSENGLRVMIKRNLNKEFHPGTASSVSFINKILEDAYTSGLNYDVTDMYNPVLAFAAGSSHQADESIKLVNKMHFKSEETSVAISNEEQPIVFYDVEVFPNLFVVCWKIQGKGKPVVRMINPTANDMEDLMRFRLVGFNCRKYDNHIIYARWMGYTNEQLYHLSKKIIDDKKGFFGEAYNISYTDIYDFSSKKQSLKKWEIELGIHHHELGLSWDKPVPEELWVKVADYCCDDVVATEAVDEHLVGDWTARQILAELAGMTVNDATNTLTTRIIFGNNRKPQDQFNYRDLAEPVHEIADDVREFLTEACPEMMNKPHGEEKSILPYFPGYKFDYGKSTYRGEEVGEGGEVYAETGMHGNVALLDIASQHPHSAIAECIFGVKFTKAFQEIVEGRVSIKHEAWNIVNNMLGGKLTPYIQMVIDGKMTCDNLAFALKIAINSVYGLTAARFDNPFKDPRNIDNIVAKRGALFMIDLKYAVQERGFTVAHIKTDSIKIPDATPEIIQFVMDYGKQYGYTFEHEATYDRMCLVNDAVYVAKYASKEKCEELYGYIPGDNKKHPNDWTATGTQFQVSYVFKKLFSKEDIIFNDMCETKSVQGALYLDMNEGLPDITGYEKEYDKLWKCIKDVTLPHDEEMKRKCERVEELSQLMETGHNYRFVGKVGQFCPVKPGCGGGILLREKDGKYYAANGSTGYRWLESEMVRELGKEGTIDRSYYDTLVDKAATTVIAYGDFEWFVSDDPYIGPKYINGVPEYNDLPFI